MYLLLILGIGMFVFGCLMVARPLQFSRGIYQFSEWRWFHRFEIVSRAIFGILCLALADQTSYPIFLKIVGVVLCFVSVFLIIIGPNRHKRFALLTSNIGKNFRALGLVAIVCGSGLVYLGSAQNA